MNTRLFVTVTSLALVAASPSRAQSPVPTPDQYAKRIAFSVSSSGQAALGAASVSDGIPVLVRLSSAIDNFNYSDFLQSGGSDLLFTDGEGNALPHDIDTWDPDGESLVWVRLPTLDANTGFYAYFGGPANTIDPTLTWAGYIGVWHMGEASGNALDATGHELHGVPTGANAAGMVACEGVIGNGRVNLSGSGSAWLTVPSYTAYNTTPAQFTFSGWFYVKKPNGCAKNPRFVSRKSKYDNKDGWEIQLALDSDGKTLGPRGASGTKGEATAEDFKNTWRYLVCVYDGSTVYVYQDNRSYGGKAIAAATDNGKVLHIGNIGVSAKNGVGKVDENDSLSGNYDEIRLFSGVMSADHVLADYLTSSMPGFFDVAVSSMAADTPQLSTPTVTANADGTFTFSVTLEGGAGDIYAVYDDGTAAVTNLLAAAATPGTYAETPPNLPAGVTYTFAAYAESPSGETARKTGGLFYNGNLVVEALADANECDLLPGAFRISRADANGTLAIAYTVGGTAVPGQTYAALPGTATLPDGATSVDIAVTPLEDSATTADATVVLALAAGPYGSLTPPATVTVREYVAPFTLAAPAVLRNGDGTYTFSAAPESGAGTAYAVYRSGDQAVTNLAQSTGGGSVYTNTPSGLAANTTYLSAALGVNATGIARETEGAAFHTGDIALTAVSDAREAGLVPGFVRFTRADTAYDLVVAYTVGGTAVPGQTYEALPGTVVIPAGQASVDLAVTPCVDGATTVDTTVVLTLAPGGYGIAAGADSATVAIENLLPPVGYNTWVAPANGLASVAANWSLGRIPVATDAILLDGRYSNADCEWDAGVGGLPATVASWTQTSGYSGAAIFDTEFATYAGASFTVFTITGDATLDSGSWTHPVSVTQVPAETSASMVSVADMRAQQHYRLRVHVGGTLTVGADAAIDVAGKGLFVDGALKNTSTFPSAHGGCSDGPTSYGNPKCPVDVGYSFRAKYGSPAQTPPGGGAVYLTSPNTVVIQGHVSADGTCDESGANHGGAAAGSVYIECPAIAGTGAIHANGTALASTNYGSGPGGRVALVTETPVDLSATTVTATAGEYARNNGVGTVYLHDSTSTHGTLRVVGARNTRTERFALTAVTAESDWTFDAIVVGGSGRISVPDGMTLTLPNGLASVSSADEANVNDGIIVKDGGTILFGDGDQVIRGGWCFNVETPFTFPASVTVTENGNLGIPQTSRTGTNDTLRASYTILGDLTITGTGYATATSLFINSSTPAGYGAHGGWGMQNAAGRTSTYGSVFHPTALGTGPEQYHAGGALALDVRGTFTLDGTVSASSGDRDNSDKGKAATGGSVLITAGTLVGTGSVSACGSEGRSGKSGGGGGGRIAIRVTDRGATVPATLAVTTEGTYGNTSTQTGSDHGGSAGTVYLQDADKPEYAGTLYIRNCGDARITATTPIVAYVDGDPVAAFKPTSLVVAGNAIAEVSAERLQMADLTVESGSSIDLAGNTFVVRSASFGGNSVPVGTYHAADLAEEFPGYVRDTLPVPEEGDDPADPGEFVVLGGYTVILLQ